MDFEWPDELVRLRADVDAFAVEVTSGLDEQTDREMMELFRQVADGGKTVVCECQDRLADAELARRNFHMTAGQVAELARRAGVGELVLFHVSDRYIVAEWRELLAEARTIFPAGSPAARRRAPDAR